MKHGQSFKTMAITINGTTGIAGVDGSASTPAVQGSDTNTGVSFGTDIVNINTGGSTRVKVDSNGNLTKPTNLCFSYTASSSQDYTGNYEVIKYATNIFYKGVSSTYNTSTGVFTAPVAGIYQIYWEFFSPHSNTAMTQLEVSTNGGSSFSAIKYSPRAVGGSSSGYQGAAVTAWVDAAANNQYRITRKEGTIHINSYYTFFNIHLVQ